MWVPFGLLFSIAVFELEIVEGNKIRTHEYMGLHELRAIYLFFMGSLVFIAYPISFFVINIYR